MTTDQQPTNTDQGAQTDHRLCRPIPEVEVAEIEDDSIGHYHSDGLFATTVTFYTEGRKFELLDKDGDGVVDAAFSFGSVGGDWLVDHDAFPADAIEYVEDHLGSLDVEIPDEFRAEADDAA